MWYSLCQVRGKPNAETVLIEDFKVLLMAVLRLNDGKHFLNQQSDVKVEKVYGSINQEGILVFYAD